MRSWSRPSATSSTGITAAFRAAHPEVIIGDGGFGVWQACIPEPDGERIISRSTLHELLDKLDELTPHECQ